MGSKVCSKFTIPPLCRPLLAAFEDRAPAKFLGRSRHCDLTWNGERVFANYDWGCEVIGTIAVLRFQFLPFEEKIWIGNLEVHRDYRGQRIATRIVRAIESAAEIHNVRSIRLFSRMHAMDFWIKQGFRVESDPRYLLKPISDCEAIG